MNVRMYVCICGQPLSAARQTLRWASRAGLCHPSPGLVWSYLIKWASQVGFGSGFTVWGLGFRPLSLQSWIFFSGRPENPGLEIITLNPILSTFKPLKPKLSFQDSGFVGRTCSARPGRGRGNRLASASSSPRPSSVRVAIQGFGV